MEFLVPHLDSFGAAALGALLGSLSAFGLGLLTERLRKLEKRHGSLVTTQYALMSQWTIIESIRRDHLEKWRSDSERFAKLSIYYAPGVPIRVPFQEITFITSTNDADLLQQVHIAEQQFDACIETLRLRNAKLEQFYGDQRVTRHTFDFETGESVISAPSLEMFFIRKLVDNLYAQVDRTLPKLRVEIDAIEKFIKKKFPGRTALNFVEPNTKADPRWKRLLRRWFSRKNFTRALLLLGTAAVLVLAATFINGLSLARLALPVLFLCLVAILFTFRSFDRWLAE